MDHADRATPRAAATRRPRTAVPRRAGRAFARVGAAYDLLPLYAGIVAVNAVVVVAGVLLLALSPLTISWPLTGAQAVALAAGAALVIGIDALLLRAGLRPLLDVLGAMRGVDLLAARTQLPEAGCAEVRELTRTFNEMLERLDDERRRSAEHALAALEGERRRVGQELHDEIGQRLTGILLELNPAIAVAPPELRERLAAVREEARETLEEVGQLAWLLRPGVLEDLGLAAALDALLSGAVEHSAIVVRRRLPAPLRLPRELELAVYRIAQEAVTNALRHAGASTLELVLAVDAPTLSLTVSDDGVGLPQDAREGPGLQGMRERAHLLDGRLSLVPHGDLGGVTVRLTLPLPAGEA